MLRSLKLYIATHYYNIVSGETDKELEALELWQQTYPRDSVPVNNLGVGYGAIGKWEKSLEKAQETIRLDPDSSFSHNVLAGAYLGLNRLAESKAIREEEVQKKIDDGNVLAELYLYAFLAGDAAGMQRQVERAKGREDEYTVVETVAEVAASSGRLNAARASYQQAVDIARRGKLEEAAAAILAREAIHEAEWGNSKLARDDAMTALSRDRGRNTLVLAGRALALAGEAKEADAIAQELVRENPENTLVNTTHVPVIRAGIALSQGNPGKAVEILQTATPYEFGYASGVAPNYLRGLAYLKLRQGKEAAGEFQKILDHRGVCMQPFATCALAHLQLGRARAEAGDTGGARTACQDFFALWKDADPDVN